MAREPRINPLLHNETIIRGVEKMLAIETSEVWDEIFNKDELKEIFKALIAFDESEVTEEDFNPEEMTLANAKAILAQWFEDINHANHDPNLQWLALHYEKVATQLVAIHRFKLHPAFILQLAEAHPQVLSQWVQMSYCETNDSAPISEQLPLTEAVNHFTKAPIQSCSLSLSLQLLLLERYAETIADESGNIKAPFQAVWQSLLGQFNTHEMYFLIALKGSDRLWQILPQLTKKQITDFVNTLLEGNEEKLEQANTDLASRSTLFNIVLTKLSLLRKNNFVFLLAHHASEFSECMVRMHGEHLTDEEKEAFADDETALSALMHSVLQNSNLVSQDESTLPTPIEQIQHCLKDLRLLPEGLQHRLLETLLFKAQIMATEQEPLLRRLFHGNFALIAFVLQANECALWQFLPEPTRQLIDEFLHDRATTGKPCSYHVAKQAFMKQLNKNQAQSTTVALILVKSTFNTLTPDDQIALARISPRVLWALLQHHANQSESLVKCFHDDPQSVAYPLSQAVNQLAQQSKRKFRAFIQSTAHLGSLLLAALLAESERAGYPLIEESPLNRLMNHLTSILPDFYATTSEEKRQYLPRRSHLLLLLHLSLNARLVNHFDSLIPEINAILERLASENGDDSLMPTFEACFEERLLRQRVGSNANQKSRSSTGNRRSQPTRPLQLRMLPWDLTRLWTLVTQPEQQKLGLRYLDKFSILPLCQHADKIEQGVFKWVVNHCFEYLFARIKCTYSSNQDSSSHRPEELAHFFLPLTLQFAHFFDDTKIENAGLDENVFIQYLTSLLKLLFELNTQTNEPLPTVISPLFFILVDKLMPQALTRLYKPLHEFQVLALLREATDEQAELLRGKLEECDTVCLQQHATLFGDDCLNRYLSPQLFADALEEIIQLSPDDKCYQHYFRLLATYRKEGKIKASHYYLKNNDVPSAARCAFILWLTSFNPRAQNQGEYNAGYYDAHEAKVDGEITQPIDDLLLALQRGLTLHSCKDDSESQEPSNPFYCFYEEIVTTSWRFPIFANNNPRIELIAEFIAQMMRAANSYQRFYLLHQAFDFSPLTRYEDSAIKLVELRDACLDLATFVAHWLPFEEQVCNTLASIPNKKRLIGIETILHEKLDKKSATVYEDVVKSPRPPE